jgi:hypothetical protein
VTAPSPEVRAESRHRARRRHSLKAWRLLIIVLAMGSLGGVALWALTAAMGGLG